MASPRFLVVVALSALALAACGGDDAADPTVPSTAPAATSTAVSEPAGAGESTGDSAADSTIVPVVSDTLPGGVTLPPIDVDSDVTTPTFTGEDSAAACAVIDQLNQTSDDVDYEAVYDPETGPAYWQAQFDLMDQLLAVAPAEIAPSVQAVVTAAHAYYEGLVAAGWDVDAADESMFDDPAVDAAGTAIDAYTVDVCGLDL